MNTPRTDLFRDFPSGVEEHFRICFFGCILNLVENTARATGSFEEVVEQFPFLVGYNNELASRVSGLSSSEAIQAWRASLDAWESRIAGHLPVRALRRAG